MDKVTRVLTLYTELLKGEKINKTIFSFQHNCSDRTFDRDIEDIRLFLSESFSPMNLNYDKISNTYYIEGAEYSQLEPLEYLFIERVLKDTSVLRQDELNKLLSHLLSNTENSQSLVQSKNSDYTEYSTPNHNKAILKIHGDLTMIITRKKCIRIKYSNENGEKTEHDIIPCTIISDMGYMYLIAYLETEEYPVFYRIDKIHSFKIIRNQTSYERERVIAFLRNYSTKPLQMRSCGRFIKVLLQCERKLYTYLFNKFRDIEIKQKNENMVEVNVTADEDDLLNWLINQPQDKITILQPEAVREKLLQMAQKITDKYGGRV